MAGKVTSTKQNMYKRPNAHPGQAYVYGNVVPKPDYEPRRRSPQPEQPKKTSARVRVNRRKALHVSRGYVVFMAVAAVLALFVCVNYVQLQSQITGRSKNITAMQEELASMKEENTTRYNVVMDSVNLEQVREKAIGEFGMTYARPDQIVEYDNPTGGYVKQYEKIPEGGKIASAGEVQN